ncbi:vacuolar protein sorting-associated protein 8 homolog isoform X2 [Phymastichus coffea]|uniref:vacuolar protein sorting-associated protein 8 homolog isoform X2 n=1 Tax=Phymastichus coffea TaxID=108790 RepID=UPI00273B36D1|nr:vacuolar protein sorting-associated protein 8 homolog isoform X2 [Phymastichus coffea]
MAEENGSNSDIGSEDNLTADIINLEIEELDDAEYAIPAVDQLPSLESILAEPDCGSLSGTDDDLGAVSLEKLSTSETISVGSLLSLNSPSRPKTRQPPQSGIILRHVILKGICAQIASASDKINAGLASAVAAGANMFVVGTSHGLVLGFDSSQTLRWCHRDTKHQGSVSALCFNHDGTRILVGFAKGHILMIDSSNGKVLRMLIDVHPPGTAVLHVKFTDSPKLALCSDSGGSVFELSFTRTMGVRGCDSKCLFSGSRGEVCSLEPLLLDEVTTHPLKSYVLVAMATLSKVIVVCIRPRMRVVLTHPLNGPPIAPPLVGWQLVVIRSVNATRVVDPVLALGRNNVIHFYQVCSEAGMRVRLMPLRRIILNYTMSNLRWVNSRSLAVLDIHEKLHLLDVRTQEDLETLDVSNVGLSYASSHFKGLSTGGNVSKAMALAGERACYNSVVTYGSQLLLLGMKSLHAICVRTWMERLRHLTIQKRYKEALELGLDFYRDKAKAVVGLRGSKQRRKQIIQDKVCQVLMRYMDELPTATDSSSVEQEIVSTCVEYCVQLECTDVLFGKLWDIVSESENLKSIYLRSLELPLLEASLTPQLPPFIAQQLVALYNQEDRLDSLQAIIILLNVECLDIHQVTTICQQRSLWEALIHLQTAALGDYTAPIHQLVPVLQKHLLDSVDSAQPWDCINLGNALLVYTSCCLTGRQFPRKSELPEGLPRKVKADVLRALLSQHSSQASDSEKQYPYLRTLLRFDAKGFLDAVAMAFQEPEFTSEIGLRQRQRVVDILFNMVTASTPQDPENSEYLSNEQKIFVLGFIADEVIECTVNLEPNSLFRIIEMLCIETIGEAKPRRENIILKLIHGNKLSSIAETTLLNLTRKAEFLRVSELLHTNRGDWESVCQCMMADSTRYSEILPLLQQLPTIQVEEIVKKHTHQLVRADTSGLANIITTRLADQMDQLLQSIQDDPQCEYALLSSLYGYTEAEKKETEFGDKEDDSESEKNESFAKLELSQESLERFLRLMCDIESTRVMRHLQGSHGCRLEQALQIVKEVNRKDAEAILLEQSGNYQDAFDLLLGRLTEIIDVSKQSESTEDEAIRITFQLSNLCRRSAGVLDWLPLVESVLSLQSNNDIEKTSKKLGEKLLKVILQTLSGTTALATVLEHILKQPLLTGGTMGDVRQLLTGVLAQSKYDQVLVQTTAKLVSLELHEALKKSLKDAGKARSINSMICPICRQVLSHAADCIVIFSCNHTYHLECLPEPKLCYECINTKGWAHPVTDFVPPAPRNINSKEKRKLDPPAFMRSKITSLRLAPPVPWPDLEDTL